ncbi:M48 family metallopeptidase [Limnohabitans sp. Hippo4]|uniref:tetratricopeptide repeat protein n=1 Tax=Limnohabitans sp. Hippo4 TaxID=1826167 RepID=UPI000D36E3E6|nr:tetratricopeptide repeat protein [Limnohabitans sp. Hippo4]PUE31990.1 hypothetical protein B9Z46_14550 [Limnohabitans sp. Hippo4]
MHLRLVLLIALASGFAPSLAWAQSAACPPAEAWRTNDPGKLSALLEACENVAVFHAARGTQLLSQGQVEEAAVSLEKALLLDPNLPGAQLDYAQALAQIGLKGSARAMLAQVLQRPDIQPTLKTQLDKAFEQPALSHGDVLAAPWQWSTLVQGALGHETNLNSATFTDTLTLMLSNGPVTIGLSDAAKPVSGPAAKTLLAVQGTTRAGSGLLSLGELSVGASLSHKTALHTDTLTGIKPDRNQTAEAVAKYSLPMIAGAASGQWQLSVGGTQFWLSGANAYSDTGYNLKFNWDRTFEPAWKAALQMEGSSCKFAPSVGQTLQTFPLSGSLNGLYSFARLEMLCKAKEQESQVVLGKGLDKAQDPARPGGDKRRLDLLLRHEQWMPLPWRPWQQMKLGQLSTWVRYAKSSDAQIYSELLGDLKTITHRTEWGLGYWVPLNKAWSAGINLEATSQRSNNTLFNLKNSGVYAGIRWSEN